jgi:hypothetical protein
MRESNSSRSLKLPSTKALPKAAMDLGERALIALALAVSLSSSEFLLDDGLDESFVTSSSLLSSTVHYYYQ